MVEETSAQRKPQTYRKSLTNFITYCGIEYTSPKRDSNSDRHCKTNYHTITTTMAPRWNLIYMKEVKPNICLFCRSECSVY